MLNVQSPAFDAYVEKRVAEKTAGIIRYAQGVAQEYVKLASGQELTKEAAEEINQTNLVPFAIDAMTKISIALSTKEKVRSPEFQESYKRKRVGEAKTQPSQANMDRLERKHPEAYEEVVGGMKRKPEMNSSRVTELRAGKAEAFERAGEGASGGRLSHLADWVSKNKGKAALGAGAALAAGAGAAYAGKKLKERSEKAG